jgi:hypothetical protein
MKQKNLETSFPYLVRYVYCILENKKNNLSHYTVDARFDSLSNSTKIKNGKKRIGQIEKVSKCIYKKFSLCENEYFDQFLYEN